MFVNDQHGYADGARFGGRRASPCLVTLLRKSPQPTTFLETPIPLYKSKLSKQECNAIRAAHSFNERNKGPQYKSKISYAEFHLKAETLINLCGSPVIMIHHIKQHWSSNIQHVVWEIRICVCFSCDLGWLYAFARHFSNCVLFPRTPRHFLRTDAIRRHLRHYSPLTEQNVRRGSSGHSI